MKNLHVLIVVGLSFVVGSCGSGGVTGKLKIASMQTSSRKKSTRKVIPGQRVAISENLMPSKTHFAYAAVDGVKFQLTKVYGEDADSSGMRTTLDFNEEIELTGDSSQAIALNQDVSFTAGNYRGISIHLENTWSVKSHCWTMKSGGNNTGYLVYTTAAGVQTKDCTSADCTTLPADYDYFEQDALSTTESYASTNDYQQETHLNFTVSAGQTPILSLLYDGSYNVTCFDGQTTYSSSTAFGGFAGMDASTHTTYYGASAPSFASYYLPLFGYVTTDADEAVPTARTFLASNNQPSDGADLVTSDSGFTFKPLTVATLVYNEAGDIVAGSTRNYQGNGTTNPFELDLEGFAAATSGGGTDFYSSGWYWDGSGSPEFVRNRKIKNFTPAALGTKFSTSVVDGDDCGQTLLDFQNNDASKDCSNITDTIWWLEVER